MIANVLYLVYISFSIHCYISVYISVFFFFALFHEILRKYLFTYPKELDTYKCERMYCIKNYFLSQDKFRYYTLYTETQTCIHFIQKKTRKKRQELAMLWEILVQSPTPDTPKSSSFHFFLSHSPSPSFLLFLLWLTYLTPFVI